MPKKKKRVTTKARFATLETRCPTGWKMGTNVTSAAATRKPRTNHGWLAMLRLSPPSLRPCHCESPSVRGTIHSARASFTVVATSTAFPP